MFDLEKRVQRLNVLTPETKLRHGVWGTAKRDSVHLFYLCHMAMHIKAGDHVLDLNCGNGDFLLKVAAKYPEVQFVGVDASKDLVEMARLRAQDLRLENICFIHISLLPGITKRFNLIVSIQNEKRYLPLHLLAKDSAVFEARYSQTIKKIVFSTPKQPRTKIWERKRIYHLPLRRIRLKAILGFLRIQFFASVRATFSH